MLQRKNPKKSLFFILFLAEVIYLNLNESTFEVNNEHSEVVTVVGSV